MKDLSPFILNQLDISKFKANGTYWMKEFLLKDNLASRNPKKVASMIYNYWQSDHVDSIKQQKLRDSNGVFEKRPTVLIFG
jgi:hypothetical protein